MKKITLKRLEIKSFVTTLKTENSLTVKGCVSALPDCENVCQPTDCNCTPTQTGTGNTNYTQPPFCPVSYPQIYCDGGDGSALCTN